MTKFLLLLFLTAMLASCQNGTKTPVTTGSLIYENTFKDNKKPKDFFVMEGYFEIRKLGPDNNSLWLRPYPLRTYSLLFGPYVKEEIEIQADVFASENGQTYPSFGIGSHGITGLQLRFTKNRRGAQLALVYNERQIISTAKCDWKNFDWCSIKLKVEKVPSAKEVDTTKGNYKIYGKCWPKDQKEPDWQIQYSGEMLLEEGQSSLLGIPYSGTDIFYDNLMIYKPQ